MARTKKEDIEVVLESEQPIVDLDALRAELRAELKAELEAETQEKLDELEKKLAETEASMEKQIRDEEKTVLQQLKEMELVNIEIPEDANNPDDIVPVGYNGVIYSIPRGKQFKVPKVIYDIWKESYEKTKVVNKRIRESTKKEISIN